MKIVKLDIDENSILAGIDAVALVEQPAIEEDFYYFSQQNFAETYTDYPEAAVEAAKQGIKRNEAIGNKCATQVGKVRAQQLANREPISLDTVRRMRAFLIRQKDNYELARDRKDYNACGYISYLLWGGPAALPWSEKVLRQAGETFVKDEYEGLEDACQPGYKAYGLKRKNGRLVPNCVPIQQFNQLLIEDIITNEIFASITEVDGIPVYATKEEAIAKAEEIGCQGYHEHTTEEGQVVYMPCETHSEVTDAVLVDSEFDLDVSSVGNYINELPQDVQDAILKELEKRGSTAKEMEDAGYVEVSKDEFYKHLFATIKATPNKPSIADFGNISVRYRYQVGSGSPIIDTTRDFCRQLVNLNKVYRIEDINEMSITGANQEFGVYDIFRYKGSYNCRHYWQEVFYKKDTKVTGADRPLAISNRILDGTTVNPKITSGTIQEQFAALDEQQMLIGPLMTPNKLIPRLDDNGDKFYVYFTEETIKKLSYKMMKDKLIDSVNIEHNMKDKVSDAYMVETWLVEDPETDKSRKYGFEPVKGQWFGIYKIDNKKVWDEYVKTGKVKGFSIEGFFEQYAMSKTQCRKNGQCACGMSQHPAGLCDGSHLNK